MAGKQSRPKSRTLEYLLHRGAPQPSHENACDENNKAFPNDSISSPMKSDLIQETAHSLRNVSSLNPTESIQATTSDRKLACSKSSSSSSSSSSNAADSGKNVSAGQSIPAQNVQIDQSILHEPECNKSKLPMQDADFVSSLLDNLSSGALRKYDASSAPELDFNKEKQVKTDILPAGGISVASSKKRSLESVESSQPWKKHQPVLDERASQPVTPLVMPAINGQTSDHKDTVIKGATQKREKQSGHMQKQKKASASKKKKKLKNISYNDIDLNSKQESLDEMGFDQLLQLHETKAKDEKPLQVTKQQKPISKQKSRPMPDQPVSLIDVANEILGRPKKSLPPTQKLHGNATSKKLKNKKPETRARAQEQPIDKSGSELCKFWPQGKCSEGDKCPFRHEGEQIIPVCRFFKTNSCTLGDKCPFLHDLKLEPCRFFHVQGSCEGGDLCPFSHEPLTPVKLKRLHAMTGPCRFYHLKGYCTTGNSCLFSHDEISEKERQELENTLLPCKYFNTPSGCKAGDSCFYLHESK
ncbi:hypothetical protein EC973_001978 [Apophysomyces ossiformis]|uniref:C3H1-type domain-containing protein n=1 Tax=Apophysomyces ossiformis TaxID=679940 RepID=A0A8H7BWJ4_9FUNG|nr:hypothetical protein EC973_001978 [Apophysomyces ossiformis]